MVPIQFSVTLDPSAPAASTEFVTFETGASFHQVRQEATFAYNHHGPEFGTAHPGALTIFYEDLVMGRPLPLKMVAHRIDGMDTIVAFALFMHRDLALYGRTAGFVGAIDFVHRMGISAMGHVDGDLEHLIYHLNDVPTGAVDHWLPGAIGWVRDYLETGKVPGTPRRSEVRVVDRGTNGFVVATTTEKLLIRVWIELYRQGFLRGVLFGEETKGRRQVLVSRKSGYVEMDLLKAKMILNELETTMGMSPQWSLTDTWLWGPPAGTLLLPEHVLQVLQRV